MTRSERFAQQLAAIVSEDEPITISPTVEVMPNGVCLSLGNINLYMSDESAMQLADLIVEGCLVAAGTDFEEDFLQ